MKLRTAGTGLSKRASNPPADAENRGQRFRNEQTRHIMKTRFSKSLGFPFAFGAALGLVAPSLLAQSPPGLSVQVSNGSVSLKGEVVQCTVAEGRVDALLLHKLGVDGGV